MIATRRPKGSSWASRLYVGHVRTLVVVFIAVLDPPPPSGEAFSATAQAFGVQVGTSGSSIQERLQAGHDRPRPIRDAGLALGPPGETGSPALQVRGGFCSRGGRMSGRLPLDLAVESAGGPFLGENSSLSCGTRCFCRRQRHVRGLYAPYYGRGPSRWVFLFCRRGFFARGIFW